MQQFYIVLKLIINIRHEFELKTSFLLTKFGAKTFTSQ
jgi:hypothetical protein